MAALATQFCIPPGWLAEVREEEEEELLRGQPAGTSHSTGLLKISSWLEQP